MTRAPDRVRSAVRSALAAESALRGSEPGEAPPLALVACSGGPDSLALAAAAAQVAPRIGWRVAAVTVDHGLQPGSAEVARTAADRCRDLGLAPATIEQVTVGAAGIGTEAAARQARYAALARRAGELSAAVVLTGHTRDDQAETVLLGLARGSGSRSLSGMARRTTLPGEREGVTLLRPLLDVSAEILLRACREWGLTPWADPHNHDTDRFSRARVRHDVLPILEDRLGPGVGAALARSADLLRDDADALDEWAGRIAREEVGRIGGEPAIEVAVLQGLPAAVRRRVLRELFRQAGVAPGAITAEHLHRGDRLVAAWRGQGPVALPGGVELLRRYGTLVVVRSSTGRPGGGTGRGC